MWNDAAVKTTTRKFASGILLAAGALALCAANSGVAHAQNAPATPPPPPLTGAAKTLKDADDAYDAHDLDKAKQLYLLVMQQTDVKDLHAQAYYGLAHIAALQKDPETESVRNQQ